MRDVAPVRHIPDVVYNVLSSNRLKTPTIRRSLEMIRFPFEGGVRKRTFVNYLSPSKYRYTRCRRVMYGAARVWFDQKLYRTIEVLRSVRRVFRGFKTMEDFD